MNKRSTYKIVGIGIVVVMSLLSCSIVSDSDCFAQLKLRMVGENAYAPTGRYGSYNAQDGFAVQDNGHEYQILEYSNRSDVFENCRTNYNSTCTDTITECANTSNDTYNCAFENENYVFVYNAQGPEYATYLSRFRTFVCTAEEQQKCLTESF